MMMGTDIEEQIENREKAIKDFNEMLDCFIKADSPSKKWISNETLRILMLKAQGNPILNQMITQLINGEVTIGQMLRQMNIMF